MALKLIQYMRVAVLGEKDMQIMSSATLDLSELLAKAGEDDCDTILRTVGRDEVEPLYKWNKEHNCWQMLS